MSQPTTPLVPDYAPPKPRQKFFTLGFTWVSAGPLVAGAILLIQIFLGAYLIKWNLLILAHLLTLFGSLSAIAFSIYVLIRARREGVLSLAIAPFVLSLLITLCSGVLCVGFGGSLDKSRHVANTARTEANMSQIIKACHNYAADNDDHFPPHLAVLLTARAITPDQLLDRNAPTPLTPFPASSLVPTSRWSTIAAEVDAHCDFTYIGADFTTSFDAPTIVLYTKPGRIHKHMNSEETFDAQGRLVAFIDAHTELVLDADLPAAFAASNAARARLGLPPITLDGPPPSPPATAPR